MEDLIICALCYTRIECDKDRRILQKMQTRVKSTKVSVSVIPFCYKCQTKILEHKISIEHIAEFLKVKPILDFLIFLFFIKLHKQGMLREPCPCIDQKFILLRLKFCLGWCPITGGDRRCPHYRWDGNICVYSPWGPDPLPYFTRNMIPTMFL
jgi:hypothetical protein